nr:integrase, catalytic region, zinc finger, CCHC-type, peptidase aspartic, catalytic [Tanacetum cinerariifolium]
MISENSSWLNDTNVVRSVYQLYLGSDLALAAVCTIAVYWFLKTISHSDLGNKPLSISFLGEWGEHPEKSIDEGPFQMGTIKEILTEGNEGALHLGLERARVYSDHSPEDKERYNANIQATNILLQGLLKDIYTLINHYTDAKDIWDNVKMLLEGSVLTKEDHES